jgi:hypothetical protein
MKSLQLSIINYQLSINDQLPINNVAQVAALKIENCKLKINSKGVV